MNELWEQLITVLDQMTELYTAILELSQKKREVLISGKAKDLEAVTRQEELLILQAGKLDVQREAIVLRIAQATGIAHDDLTVGKIRELADQDTAAKLADQAASLDNLMRHLAPLNELNAALIQQGLSFINYNINLLARSEAGPTYAPPQGAGSQASQGRALFDRKA